MKKFTHHHIKRHNNQVFVGTQNPLPGFDLETINQPIDNINKSNQAIDDENNSTDNANDNDDVNQENEIDNINIDNDNTNIQIDSDSKSPPQTLKRSSSLPINSDIISYTVQEGDTLQSISDNFGVRITLLKKANRIYDENKLHPGEVLQIFTNFDISQKPNPIDISIYSAAEQTEGPSGKLSIKNSDLIFTPKSIFHHSHHINLSGYLESDVFPHPSNDISIESTHSQLYILVINYLSDPSDKTTSVTEYFTGSKIDLENFRIEIIKVADLAQEKNNYNLPNPNSIYYSQDFSNNIILHATKKRSNSGREPKAVITPAATQTMKIFLSQIKLLNGHLELIKPTEVFLIRKQLPARYQNSNWTRLYKNTIDGSFLKTFYRKVANIKPLLFFLKTTAGDLIGAFITTPLIISDNYYGNGDMFLFNFKVEVPTQDQITSLSEYDDQISSEKIEFDQESSEKVEGGQINSEKNDDEIISHENNVVESSPLAQKHTPKPRTVIKTYRWNSLRNFNNKLFILSNMDSILFGGGDSSALFINQDMCSGYSDPCETFNSPRLTKKKKFDVSVIEVWQVG